MIKLIHATLAAVFLLSNMAFAKTQETDDSSRTLVEIAKERRFKPLSEFSPDEHQLFVYERELLREFQAGNIDEAMDIYLAEDAIVCPPHIERITGRDNQKAMFNAWLATEGVEIDWEPVDVYVGPSGDMAYVYGLVRWKTPGEPRKFGQYISIWVKEDGRWLNKVETRNLISVED